MKIFKIFDEEQDLMIGTLLYYEKSRDFVIELVDTLDEWTAPLLLTAFVKKGIFTIPRDISLLWVKERIIPSGRQNIGAILNTHKLKQYEEITFLELSGGRCSQDYMYVKKVEVLPDYVVERAKRNVKECVVLNNETILCFFEDDTIRKIDLKSLGNMEEVEIIQKHTALLQSCKVGTGGYSITFNDNIDIPAHVLYSAGIEIPLSLEDFIMFIRMNTLDTGESCNLLECSRQNISYILKQGQLVPLKKDIKGNLFLKGNILRNMW